MTDVRVPIGIPHSNVDGVLSISDLYPRLVSAMNHLDKVEPLARSGIIGVSSVSYPHLDVYKRQGQLFALAHVGRDRDHLAVVVVFLQPRDNNRGIQPSGIRQDYLFDRLHASSFLSVCFCSLLCDFVAFFHIISAVVRFCKREKRIFMLSRLFLSP